MPDLTQSISDKIWELHPINERINSKYIKQGFLSKSIRITDAAAENFRNRWGAALTSYQERFCLRDDKNIPGDIPKIILGQIVQEFLEKEGDQL